MKKKFVSFLIPKDRGFYWGKDFNSDEMSVLEMFFSVDYSLYRFSRLVEWINDPGFYYRHANITFIRKKLGRVIIGDLYDKESISRKFSLPVRDFIKLLNDWERVASKKPMEIVITKEGDEVTVQGKN